MNKYEKRKNEKLFDQTPTMNESTLSRRFEVKMTQHCVEITMVSINDKKLRRCKI